MFSTRSVLAATLALGAVAGCSSGGSSPTSAVQAAVKATLAAGSVQEMAAVVVPTASGKSTASATGNYSFAMHQGAFTVDTGGIAGKLDAAIDASTLYIHLPAVLAAQIPGKKAWVKADLLHPPTVPGVTNLGVLANGADPYRNLEPIELGIASAQKIGTEKVGSDSTTHYLVMIDLNKAKAAAAADRKATIQAEIDQLGTTVEQANVYVGASGKLRRTVTSVDNGPSKGGLVTTDLLAFGVPVNVTLPGATDTIDAAALFGAP